MFGRSFRVGRIGGVEIRVDASWTVIALLITYSLFLQFTAAYPTLTSPAGFALALAAAVLFFGSVLTHEMTHALVARRVGIPVMGITLFIFGGATHADVASKGPKDEFVVSVVGPLSSLALGGIFWSLSILAHALLLPRPLQGALGYLGWVNGLLAAFNLLPGFPLDGGRVFRSAVWGATHSLERATRAASILGETIGYLMVAGGFVLVFGAAVVSGIWFAAIGWFLAQAARASWREFEVRGLLAGAEVEQVMEPHPIAIPADLPLSEAVDHYLLPHDQGAFPVEELGRTVGMLTIGLVRAVPRSAWERRTVREAMAPVDERTIVGPHTPMAEVLKRLEEQPSGFVLVMADGQIEGVVTVADLGTWLHRRQSLAA